MARLPLSCRNVFKATPQHISSRGGGTRAKREGCLRFESLFNEMLPWLPAGPRRFLRVTKPEFRSASEEL